MKLRSQDRLYSSHFYVKEAIHQKRVLDDNYNMDDKYIC